MELYFLCSDIVKVTFYYLSIIEGIKKFLSSLLNLKIPHYTFSGLKCKPSILWSCICTTAWDPRPHTMYGTVQHILYLSFSGQGHYIILWRVISIFLPQGYIMPFHLMWLTSCAIFPVHTVFLLNLGDYNYYVYGLICAFLGLWIVLSEIPCQFYNHWKWMKSQLMFCYLVNRNSTIRWQATVFLRIASTRVPTR